MYYHKVIQITAEDSPNVKLYLEQVKRGIKPTFAEVVPNVLSAEEYLNALEFWDEVAKCVGLHGQFYKGAVLLLFPPDRLNDCQAHWRNVARHDFRGEEFSLGVDTAEGGDNTSWAVTSPRRLAKLVSMKTPDTSVIPGITQELMREWSIPANRVCFDRGGGGQEHADVLRNKGIKVRTVAFGEAVVPEIRRGQTQFDERVENREIKYVYKNRRAQMYHEASLVLDERWNPDLFALPDGPEPCYRELRRQLAVMPKLTDDEGRYWMLPKDKKDKDSKVKTLKELIGHSPDEADSFVLSIHAGLHRGARQTAGAVA